MFGGLGFNLFMKYSGVFAEYSILPDHVVVRKPCNISFEAAGGIGQRYAIYGSHELETR